MKKYKNRNEVPEKYKWILTDFFKDEKDFNNHFKIAEEKIEHLNTYKGCTKDKQKLYEFLSLEVEALNEAENLYVYAYLINDQELGIKESIERKNKTMDLLNLFNQNTNFFESELLELNEKKFDSLFEYDKLHEFEADLKNIYRNKIHILSESEENIISRLTNAMDNFDDLSSNMLNQEHNYGKIIYEDKTAEKIATNNYRFLLQNKNRNVRKKAYNLFNKTLDQYGATSAGLLNSYVKANNTVAKLHHFENAWDRKLFSQNLSNKVFDALVTATENNVGIFQKYIQLKKRILGYDKMYYYDTKVNLVENNREYSIEEAQDIVMESLKTLGKGYLEKLYKIFDNHYIDYCQYPGKCSGGYSCSTMSHDSRILMSYNGNLDSVSTIAHESGHNVHHQYLKENNLLQYRDQTTMVSEVTALLNECLLSNYIAKNAKTKEEKLSGIEHILNVISSNLFGAVREGKIEQEMYKMVDNGGTITKEFMDDLVKKSYKKYFGKNVVLEKHCKNSWITRNHYYTNFYLYSYAISICVAANLAQKILNGDQEALNNYKEFLCVGNDKWTKEAFEIIDIDLEEKLVYENAIQYFDSLINEFESLLEKE